MNQYNLPCIVCGNFTEYNRRYHKPKCEDCKVGASREYYREWRKKNYSKIKEYRENWRQANRRLHRSANARYRARAKGYKLKDPLEETETHKQCGECRVLLPKTEFDKYSNHDKLSRKCRSCTKAYHSRYRFKKKLCTTKQ